MIDGHFHDAKFDHDFCTHAQVHTHEHTHTTQT